MKRLVSPIVVMAVLTAAFFVSVTTCGQGAECRTGKFGFEPHGA